MSRSRRMEDRSWLPGSPVPAWMVLVAGLLAGALLPSLAAAQSSVTQANSRDQRKAELRQLNSELGEAARLLRTDPDRALLMLRRLYDRHPREVRVMNSLGQAYQAQGKIDSSMAVYRRCLALHRNNHEAVRALIALHYARSEDRAAEEMIQRFLNDSRHGLGAYRLIGHTLSDVGRYELAFNYYRQGLERSDKHYQLKMDVADLERALGNHLSAMKEYLDYVEYFPAGYRPVKKIIHEMMTGLSGTAEGMKTGDALISLVEGRAPLSGRSRFELLDILAEMYLARGLLEKSLDAALASDRAKPTSGENLFLYTEKLWNGYLDNQGELRLRYFDTCGRALEAYVKWYPRNLLAPKAAYRQAYLAADAARGIVAPPPGPESADLFASAITLLDKLISTYPGAVEAAQAAMVKGDLLFEVGRDPRQALAVYQAGLKMSSQTTSVFVEKIGRMFLVLEDYASARRHFDKFIRSSHQKRRQAGIYYLGVLLSFTGEYDAAVDTLTSLARLDATSDYTNDAIELAWAIEEGLKNNEKALGYYIQAAKARMARDTTGVIDNIERIVAEGEGSALRPRALLELGEAYAMRKDYARAMERLEQFADQYGDHYLRPDVHRTTGRVYEYGLMKLDLALREYQTILLKYPDYLFIDEVRADITRLEQSGKDIP